MRVNSLSSFRMRNQWFIIMPDKIMGRFASSAVFSLSSWAIPVHRYEAGYQGRWRCKPKLLKNLLLGGSVLQITNFIIYLLYHGKQCHCEDTHYIFQDTQIYWYILAICVGNNSLTRISVLLNLQYVQSLYPRHWQVRGYDGALCINSSTIIGHW